MSPERRARRVRPYLVSGPCNCAACAEREQLNAAARFHPEVEVRVQAMTFLGFLDKVHEGTVGAVSVSQLFD
jgi:hypothetical protein